MLARLVQLFWLPALLLAVACGESPELPPDQLMALLAQPNAPLLLDVRTPEEFARGHIPGAVLVPVAELQTRLAELAPFAQRGVVTYCEKGPRAERAADVLRAAGFENVRPLAGSFARWRAEGREVAVAPAT
jgi:rhodanese-related sulfurtransferase